jgi:hypothetical protein
LRKGGRKGEGRGRKTFVVVRVVNIVVVVVNIVVLVV